MSSISTCLIVRDEEARIPGLLDNVSRFSDEIIVVDTGSKDKTIQLLSEHPKVRLFHFDWCDDFAKARNYSIDQATSEWVLVLDADEIIEAPAELASAVQSNNDAFYLMIKNLQPEGSLTKYEESYVCRLFRNLPHHRYVGRIHEQVTQSVVDAGGKISYSPVTIVHSGYQTSIVQGSQHRRERNKRIILEILKDHPDDEYYLYHLGLTIRFEDPTQAYALFVRAIQLAGGSMAPHLLEEMFMRMSQISLEQSDYASAIREGLRCVAVNRLNTTALVVLIVSYMSTDAPGSALPYLRTIVNHGLSGLPNPSDFVALADYCEQFVKEGAA